MKVLAVLLIAVAVASAFEMRASTAPNDDKVLVELYYESLCPYCQQFLNNQIKKVVNVKDIWLISDFKLWPYGNARTAQNGSSWSFTCQHGVAECVGNIVEACVLNIYDYYSQALPFVLCFEEGAPNWNTRYLLP